MKVWVSDDGAKVFKTKEAALEFLKKKTAENRCAVSPPEERIVIYEEGIYTSLYGKPDWHSSDNLYGFSLRNMDE